ncbi:MAG: hypothetical protein N3B14_09330 [Thermoleophilia bacterium]|nr:hypothetical protein [Thermoleophilia bacterium]
MCSKAVRIIRALVVLTAAALLAVSAVSCGDSQSAATGDGSPQALLNRAFEATKTIESLSGKFEVVLTVELDEAQAPPEALEFLAEPVEISGTFALTGKEQNADYQVNFSAAGKTVSVGAKLAGGKAWLELGKQWYEVPTELLKQAAEFPYDEQKMEQIRKLLEELGFDPVSWFKDLRLEGEEKLGGVSTYHLVGTPDPAKIVADLAGLLESQELMQLLLPPQAGAKGFDKDLIPSAEEIKKLESQATQIMRSAGIEFWVEKNGQALRKLTVSAKLVPLTEEQTEGLNSVTLEATVSLDRYNEPIKVQAPASALSFAELQKTLSENPEQLLGPFMELIPAMEQRP